MSLRASLVSLPLLSPFANSKETVASREAILLEYDQDGMQAYSECIADAAPSSTGEDNKTALRAIRGPLAKAIHGGAVTPSEFLADTESVKESPMAKGAVEALLWDYIAKAAGRPLDVVLGASKGRAEAGIALGITSVEELRSRVAESLEQGYKRVKVKVDRKTALGVLSDLRDSFPSAPLSADANGCFTLKDLALLRRLDRFELQYIEQPLAKGDITGHSRLSKEISTPICLDESVTGLDATQEILEKGAASVINVKAGRVGGLTIAMEIARLARERGAHVWAGGMLETGIGRSFNVALAAQREFDYPGDTSPNSRYFRKDVVRNPFKMRSGTVRTNKGPGLGVEIDRAALGKATVRSWKIF